MNDFIKKRNKTDTRTILAVLSVLGVFSYIGLLFIVPVPQENVALLNTLMPILVSSVVVVAFAYYFGSSKDGNKTNIKTEEEN